MQASDVVPFLKWAGGKRWLTASEPDLFPREFERYVEPFLGSGAVFFHLCPPRSLLSDSNSDLINTYKAIKTDYQLLVRKLAIHQRNHSREYYYDIRSSVPTSPTGRAARFIYLNRTCWNGLYRVNLKGQFNVPIGTKSSVLLETDNFRGVSARLKRAQLSACDFRRTIEKTKSGDFLFVDPPYTVQHNHNGFVKYNESIFSWEDQEALFTLLVHASGRGVKILMTNANHPSIKKLYRNDFDFEPLNRASVIAASPKFRSETSELIVRNY